MSTYGDNLAKTPPSSLPTYRYEVRKTATAGGDLCYEVVRVTQKSGKVKNVINMYPYSHQAKELSAALNKWSGAEL